MVQKKVIINTLLQLFIAITLLRNRALRPLEVDLLDYGPVEVISAVLNRSLSGIPLNLPSKALTREVEIYGESLAQLRRLGSYDRANYLRSGTASLSAFVVTSDSPALGQSSDEDDSTLPSDSVSDSVSERNSDSEEMSVESVRPADDQLTKEDIALIETLYQQDADLGVSFEFYNNTLRSNASIQKPLEVDVKDTSEPSEPEQPFNGNYTVDAETGEFVPFVPSSNEIAAPFDALLASAPVVSLTRQDSIENRWADVDSLMEDMIPEFPSAKQIAPEFEGLTGEAPESSQLLSNVSFAPVPNATELLNENLSTRMHLPLSPTQSNISDVTVGENLLEQLLTIEDDVSPAANDVAERTEEDEELMHDLNLLELAMDEGYESPQTSAATDVASTSESAEIASTSESTWLDSDEMSTSTSVYSEQFDRGTTVAPDVRSLQHNHTYTNASGGAQAHRALREPVLMTEDGSRRLTRDERRARQLNLPFTIDQVIAMPIAQFMQLQERADITKEQWSLMRDVRRRGKNKLAARSCRQRKMNVIGVLSDDVERLVTHKHSLVLEQQRLLDDIHEQRRLVEKFNRQLLAVTTGPAGSAHDRY